MQTKNLSETYGGHHMLSSDCKGEDKSSRTSPRQPAVSTAMLNHNISPLELAAGN